MGPAFGNVLFRSSLPASMMDLNETRIDGNRQIGGDDLSCRQRTAQWAGIGSIEANGGQMRFEPFRLTITGRVQGNIEVSLKSLLHVPVRLAVTNGDKHSVFALLGAHAIPHATRLRTSTCSTLNCANPAVINRWRT